MISKDINNPFGKGLTGFTVIELLVVITIIALLAGLLVPTLMRARVAAWEAMAQTQIADLSTALSMYQSDYGLYPPDDGDNSTINLVSCLGSTSAHGAPYYNFRESQLEGDPPEFYSPLGGADDTDQYGDYAYHYRENASESTKTGDMHIPFSFDFWTRDARRSEDAKYAINNWE